MHNKMWLTKCKWITAFIILAIYTSETNGWEKYKNFYFNIIMKNGGSTNFLFNSLWNGLNFQGIYDNNSMCHNDFINLKNGIEKKETWAIQMFDSSTHLQSGFLEGNIEDYGNVEECVKVNNEINNFKGQMCQIGFYPEDEEVIPELIKRHTIIFSVCIPSSCSEQDLSKLLTHGVYFQTKFSVVNCQTQETFSPPYDAMDFYIIISFIVLVVIVLVSTLLDLLSRCCYDKNNTDNEASLLQTNKKHESLVQGILKSFSLYNNGKALLREDTNPESIKALHGLRFFSACGVLCVHRYLIDPQPLTNMFLIETEVRKWYRLIVFNGYLWVDVFFLMSGLLVSYSFFIKGDHKKRFDIWGFYLHRYFRLTPTLAAVIMLSLMSDHMCEGPHCRYLNNLFKKRCEENWWASLLYISNIYNQLDICVIQGWYLSADMQMFLILAPVLLYTYKRWPRLIFIQLLIFFNLITSYVYYISYKLNLPPTFIGPPEFYTTDSQYIYNQSYARAGPWLIGFGLGIILHRHNQTPIKLSKFSVISGWIIATLFCIGAMFGMAPFIQADHKRQPVIESLYKALYRDVWAFGFAWIIYACFTGYGGFVNKFLSSRAFQPVSRITYSFFLIHIFGLFLLFQNGYVPRRYSDITQFTVISGDVVLNISLATILFLTVEAPSLNIEKMLCRRKAIKEVEEPKRRIVKEA